MLWIREFLKLIRVQNLLIVVFTMAAIRYCVLGAILKVNGFELVMDEKLFWFLVLAVVFIAAAGYALNDFFDLEIDKINKKFDSFEFWFRQKFGFIVFVVFLFLGVVLGYYVSYSIGYPKFSWIFVVSAFGVILYSMFLKKVFILNNLAVAFLTALVPLMLLPYDLLLVLKEYRIEYRLYGLEQYWILVYWVLGYGFFAFWFTLIREIVKDIVDYEGDLAYNVDSLFIVLGEKWVKVIVSVLLILALVALAVVFWLWLRVPLSLGYFVVFLVLPIGFTLVYFWDAKSLKQYKTVSLLLKLIMLFGISYSFVACYIFSRM